MALATAVLAVVAASSAPAQPQFEELRKRGLPPDNEDSTVMAIGDVDGDGDLDLLVGGSRHYGFHTRTRLYLNDGRGNFADGTSGRLPAVAADKTCAFGDLDGDGDLDLVSDWMIGRNDGSGCFLSFLPPAYSGEDVALGDVDGDGDLDAMYAFSYQNWLLLNDGTGQLVLAWSNLPFGANDSRAVALGDVDGDGDLDAVFGAYGKGWLGRQNRLYLNDGTGVFSDVTGSNLPVSIDFTSDVALGDVDGDGDLDLVFGGRTQLLLNDGSGRFRDVSASQLPRLPSSTRIGLTDVDGDGDLDLVSAVGHEQNTVFLNDGRGFFTDQTAARLPAHDDQTFALAWGDVDGDSDVDLVFGNRDLRAYGAFDRLYQNDGTGHFVDATVGPFPGDFQDTAALAVGDVDGDGDVDLFCGENPNLTPGPPIRLYRNDGRGRFADGGPAQFPLRSGLRPIDVESLAPGDVDGDGDLDLVVATLDSVVLLYLNDGTGHYTDHTAGRLGALDLASQVALGDVDGDGDLDLLADDVAVGMRLFLNSGTGVFSEVTSTHVPPFTNVLAFRLGDVDGDGDLDVAAGRQGLPNGLLLNDGTGRFTDRTATHMPAGAASATALAIGDVDGDGDLDLVLAVPWAPNLLYLNDGSGRYVDASLRMPAVTGTESTGAIELGDVDEDGDLDVVCGNTYGFYGVPLDHLYLNDGTGTFTDATAVRLPGSQGTTKALALADLDGDRDLDLVFGDRGRNRVFVNLHRQLHVPSLLRVGDPYPIEVYVRHSPSVFDVAFPFVSTGAAHFPVPPFGTFGLDPNRMMALPPAVVPQPQGVATWSLAVPQVPSLAGLSLYTQAVVVRYPFLPHTTAVTADVVLR